MATCADDLRRRAQVLLALEQQRRDGRVRAAGGARGGRPGSGQRRQRSISSAYATSASNGWNAAGGSASAFAFATAKRCSSGVPRGHGSGVSSHTVA